MIKIKTGYNADQYIVIPDEEAHVAYYIFARPDARAIFSNGCALRGSDIVAIEPAWNEMMGWNPSHKLSDDDWNQIKATNVEARTRRRMEAAKLVAGRMTPQDMKIPLPKLVKQYGIQSGTYAQAKSIGDALKSYELPNGQTCG